MQLATTHEQDFSFGQPSLNASTSSIFISKLLPEISFIRAAPELIFQPH
jgi:hypothetical protein